MSPAVEKRVLSIQSSVVFGYVGNKSATFPLQLHGYDVSPMNSVQFSNHSGYKLKKGQVLNAEEATELIEGLRINGLLNFSHVLTGYIGSDSFLKKVGETVKELKAQNPDLTFVCDPVMGDNGRLYVSEKLVPVYRTEIVEQADIITPNQFELEQLTQLPVSTESEAFQAMETLHQRGVRVVVLSSSSLGQDDTLVCLASCKEEGGVKKYRLKFPKLDAIFTGTGDLFTATLMTWMDKDKNLKSALEKTVSVVQSIIKKTLEHAQGLAGPGVQPSREQMELRTIHAKELIENPQVLYAAEEVL